MDGKQIFNNKFAWTKAKYPQYDVSTIAAKALKWFGAANEAWNTAPLKRGDVDALIVRCKTAGSFSEAIRLVGSTFSDPLKLGKCFPLPLTEIIDLEEDDFEDLRNFDWQEADRAVNMLVQSNAGVANSMGHALRTLAIELVAEGPKMRKSDGRLRALRIAMMVEGIQSVSVAQILKGLSHAPKDRKEALARFLMQTWGISRAVEWLNDVIRKSIEEKSRAFSFEYVDTAMQLLSMIWEWNRQLPLTERSPPSHFLNQKLAEHAAEDESFLNEDFIRWHSSQKGGPPQSFAACPFILDTASKAHILQVVAELEQREQFQQAAGGGDVPFLIIRVRRANLVEDTMLHLARFSKTDLRKPMKVQFLGEEGVDAGGLRKEYYQLMMRQLLDSSYAMFREFDPQTKLLYFNADSFEAQLQFELVGTLIGLAITNRVIIDVPFPRVLYKLLLEGANPSLTLDDLSELDPGLASGLGALLNFDGDVEAVFCRTFQASRETWGEVQNYDLIPNGSLVPVNNSNREEYVRLYLNWVLVQSVNVQLSAFRKGFFSVMDEELLRDLLFTPEELELLVVGVRSLDFKALQASARYDDRYDEHSRTIVAFWNVAHSFSDQEKRTLLKFITGSDRVPIRGLSDIRIVISRAGSDSDRLPSAHTCFDHLLLPDYGEEDKLRAKLKIALEHAEGFFTR
jgi:hypothetical protein